MTKHVYVFLILFVSSCASIDTESPYAEFFRGIGSYFFDRKQEVSDEFIESFPYSFAIVTVGRSPEYRLVLVDIEDNTYEWISADYVRIFTKNGRIVKTFGLQHDIEYRNFADITTKPVISQSMIVDYFEPPLYSVMIEANYSYDGDVVIEDILSSALGWRGQNKYKISKTGDVIETEQMIHPFLPVIKMKFYPKKNSAK